MVSDSMGSNYIKLQVSYNWKKNLKELGNIIYHVLVQSSVKFSVI